MLNSDLPPNKILHTYTCTNVNKINRVKDEHNDNNLKIQKLNEKKCYDEKLSNSNVDGILKINVRDDKRVNG